MRQLSAPLFIMLIGLSACDKPAPKETPTEQAPSTQPQEQAKPAQEAPKEEAKQEEAAPDLDEAKARELVQRWVSAQNEGSFEDYKATYASKLTGIKRIKERVFNFNHDGWFKDRERMFKKKMSVSADDLKLQSSSSTIIANFTQTWESGTYKDVGPKQLVIIKEGDELKIAREEMLESHVERVADEKPKFNHSEFSFARVYDRQVGFDLGTAPQEAIGKGLTLLSKEGVASKPVDESKLDAQTQALKGKAFTLYGPQGQVCQGKVTGFIAAVSVTPHFGMRQVWEDDKYSDTKIADDIWGLGDVRSTRQLAIIDADPSKCKGAVFARESSLAAPVLYKPEADASSFREPAAKLYRSTSSYSSRAKDWADSGEKGQWFDDQFDTIKAFTHPSKPHTIISVVDAYDGCDAPVEGFWHIFEAKDQSYTDVLSPAPSLLFGFVPSVVADIDGDGQPEIFNQDILLHMVGTRYKVIEDIEPPYFDCPC